MYSTIQQQIEIIQNIFIYQVKTDLSGFSGEFKSVYF